MAKVKIQGNASGTGVLTVTAPNTSTDRVITLPDGDVTLGAATPSIVDNGDATAMTINSSEQIGVGTTTHHDNTTKLTVAGRINTSNGTATGSMNYGGGSVVNMGALTNHPVNLMVNNSTKWVIDTNGNLIAEGGGGIVLGNTSYAAANTLDDYEEGTWTPVSITGTASSQSGTYTRIGRFVHCEGTLTFPSQTNSGHATVGGLPFTINNSNGSRPSGSIRYTAYSAQDLFIHGNPNGTTFNLYKKDTGGVGQTTYTDMSSRRFDFNFQFQV